MKYSKHLLQLLTNYWDFFFFFFPNLNVKLKQTRELGPRPLEEGQACHQASPLRPCCLPPQLPHAPPSLGVIKVSFESVIPMQVVELTELESHCSNRTNIFWKWFHGDSTVSCHAVQMWWSSTKLKFSKAHWHWSMKLQSIGDGKLSKATSAATRKQCAWWFHMYSFYIINIDGSNLGFLRSPKGIWI